MEISNQLLKPIIEKLCDEYQELDQQLNLHLSEETRKLKNSIQKKIRQLELLDSCVSSMVKLSENNDCLDLRNTLREFKLELRFAQRKWKRQSLYDIRINKKNQPLK